MRISIQLIEFQDLAYPHVSPAENVKPFVPGSGEKDLLAEIIVAPSIIEVELPAYIGTHQPRDLGSIIDIHDPENLTAYIRGFDFRDLSASTYILYSQSLPALAGGHLPEDLSGYIKPWPEEDLPGFIYGWDTKDLNAVIRATYYENLSAVIATHRPGNIRSLIKGWVREATYDLGASVRGFAEPIDLSAYILMLHEYKQISLLVHQLEDLLNQ